MNKETEKAKETFPPITPYREKEKEKEIPPDPDPDYTRAREGTSPGQGPASGGSSPGPASGVFSPGPVVSGLLNCPGPAARRHVVMCYDTIVLGDMGTDDGRRNDPVQVAMLALNIPKVSTVNHRLQRR